MQKIRAGKELGSTAPFYECSPRDAEVLTVNLGVIYHGTTALAYRY